MALFLSGALHLYLPLEELRYERWLELLTLSRHQFPPSLNIKKIELGGLVTGALLISCHTPAPTPTLTAVQPHHTHASEQMLGLLPSLTPPKIHLLALLRLLFLPWLSWTPNPGRNSIHSLCSSTRIPNLIRTPLPNSSNALSML